MHQPAAIYGFQLLNLEECPLSLTQKVILSHAREALSGCVDRIGQLRSYVANSPLKNASFDSRIHTLVSDICYQAGVASTILFTRKKSKNASKTSRDLAKERYEYVQRICQQAGLNCPTLRNREIRNALTHIDERLADAMTADPGIGWFIDVAFEPELSQKHREISEHRYCRCYDTANDRILHLGQELHLSSLKLESEQLLLHIFKQQKKS